MSKELWTKAHEELIEEAMEADPTLDWSQAYTLTAAGPEPLEKVTCPKCLKKLAAS
jgi:hypothetical protein